MSNIQKKQAIVQKLTEKLANSHFYITDSQGLNVQQVNELRKLCYEKSIHYQVVKNTLLEKTFTSLNNEDVDYALLKNQALKGSSSIFITQQTASEPAKIIKNFQKTKKSVKPLLKGAVVDGELYIGSPSLDALSKIKSKEVLISELINLLKSPAQHVIASLQGAQNKLSSIIKALPR